MTAKKIESSALIAGVFTTSNQTGTGTGTNTYALVASGLRIGIGHLGDITGNFKGTGTGTLKKSKPLGIGLDDDTKRANWLAAWLSGDDGGNVAHRAAIHASIQSDNFIGNELHAIAQSAAQKQSGKIFQLRNVQSSETSRNDAIQDAVASILQHVRRLDKLTPEQWQLGKVRRVLSLYANRGAFLSLANWSRVGMTGDNTAPCNDNSFMVALTMELAANIPDKSTSLDTLCNSIADGKEQRAFNEQDSRARWSLARWVYRVGVQQFAAQLPKDMRPQAKAVSMRAAKQRARAIAAMLFGASLQSACDNVGFASIKSFAQSCKDNGLFEALRNARAASITDSQHVEQARIAMRRYALEVKQAWLALATFPSCADFDGTTRNAYLFTLQGRQMVVKDTARARLATLHLGRGLIAKKFQHALKMAIHYRNVAQRHVEANLEAFENIFSRRLSNVLQADNAQFDTLAHVTGLQDSKGRIKGRIKGSSKQDAATIGKARGKIARKRRNNDTVSLTVGRSRRTLPCAILAPSDVQDYGARLAASFNSI